MDFVLDNSIACGWFIDSQASPQADAVAQRLQTERAAVPAIWELELTNVLRTACLRQRMTAQQAQATLARLLSLPIDVDRQPGKPSALLALALRFGLTSYDASYLDLALRLQRPLATRDGPLHEAALACGVGVLV